jgi:hypothetical protein
MSQVRDHTAAAYQGDSCLPSVVLAVQQGLADAEVYARLAGALQSAVGFKVLTVLRIDPATLRSVRLFSSEPSYPIGGNKQHARNAWSTAIFERREVFLAPGYAEVRAAFPDSGAIEAVGCASIIAVPVPGPDGTLGTMNLWHEDGFYDQAKADRAVPFAAAIAPLCARSALTSERPST